LIVWASAPMTAVSQKSQMLQLALPGSGLLKPQSRRIVS